MPHPSAFCVLWPALSGVEGVGFYNGLHPGISNPTRNVDVGEESLAR